MMGVAAPLFLHRHELAMANTNLAYSFTTIGISREDTVVSFHLWITFRVVPGGESVDGKNCVWNCS